MVHHIKGVPNEISNSEDVIDVRDIIARIEYLRSEIENGPEDDREDNTAELAALETFMDQMAGYGGDEWWEDSWYPITLIRGSYFKEYAQELAEDIGGSEMREARWPFTCIDWDKAARELQMDYSTADFDGVTYWYR